jgi:hypothetical protein
MPKISVVTPTFRLDGLQTVAKSLQMQTFPHSEIEWIICSPTPPNQILLLGDKIPPVKWLKDSFKEDKPYLFGVLNHIYNHMIRESSGEIIVSIQDWIWFPKDTLELFWQHHEAFKAKGQKAYLSGIGDQYGEIDKYGKPQVVEWKDPRRDYWNQEFYECPHDNIEANFCYYPRELFYDIGGWDEKLDELGIGMDNVSVSQRAEDAGWHSYLDKSIECRAYNHEHDPRLKSDKHNMYGNYQRRMMELKMLPNYPKLDYLKEGDK